MGTQSHRIAECGKEASCPANDAAGVDSATIYSKDRAAGILLMLVGMALQWASLHSITFFDTVSRAEPALSSHHAWSVNSVFTFTVFLVLFVFSKRISTLLERRLAFRAVSVCLAVGIACLTASSLLPAMPSALLYVGNAFIACGMTPLIVMWGEMYRYLDPKDEQLLVTLAAIVLSVAVYLVEISLPPIVALVVFALLPFASLASLGKALELLEGTSRSWGVRAKSSMQSEKSPALFFVCIVAFSIPYNYLRTRSDLQAAFMNAGDWSSVLAITIVLMVIAALVEYASERRGVLLIPSLVLFLLSAAMLVNLLFEGAPPLMVPSFLYSGYYLFLAMVYLALGPLVAATDVDGIQLFSSAMLANVGGLLAGSMLGSMDLLVGEQAATLTVMVITYAIFFAGCMLLYSRSYSIFRVNFYDGSLYSFEYLAPMAPIGSGDDAASAEEAKSLLAAISAQCTAAKELYGLSAREQEVLVALAKGLMIDSIAAELLVSKNTVKAHTKAIYRKLEVHTREELQIKIQNISKS